MKKSKIKFYEPWFFIFFGLFHLHRIWGLIDREGYAGFWINVLNEKGIVYYGLMGILCVLCILGEVTFIKNIENNYWWRWIYIFGGGYLMFDLIAILTEFSFWKKLILSMFDTKATYWNVLWGGFIVLGAAVFILGIKLFYERRDQVSKRIKG